MDTLLKAAYARATTHNFLYTRHRDRWQFLLNSYVGGDEYKRGGYLHRYQLESDKEYARRIEQTPLDNQVKSVISLYISFLFRKTAERDLGDLETDSRIIDLLEDADLEGRNFNAFMREVAVWSQVFGHCWVAVSQPSVNAATLADQMAQGVRPYLSVLTPLVVVDWTWQRNPNGSYDLSMIRYIEEINDTFMIVKEWSKTEIITTQINIDKKEAASVETEPNQLGSLPFVQVYAERSPVRGIGLSLVDDIADQQRQIYCEQSEIWDSIRLDTHPSLAATQDTDVGTGAGALIRLPDNLPADLKPYILEFSGAPIEKIYASINERKKMIDGMANVGSVRSTEIREQSGVAIATEFALLNAKLCLLADGLELAEEQIWQLICDYLQLSWQGEIEYPGSFEMRDTERELQQLLSVYNAVQDPIKRAAIEHEMMELLGFEAEEVDNAAEANLELEEEGTDANGCPIVMTDKELNIANHKVCVEEANLGPARPSRPGVFWIQRADRLGITEEQSLAQTCSNCGFYVNTQTIKSCFQQNQQAGNIPQATEVDPSWENVANPAGYCLRWDITCTPTRTCDTWKDNGPIVGQ